MAVRLPQALIRLALFGLYLIAILVGPQGEGAASADSVRGAIDLPASGAVSGAIGVEGWAIDLAGSSGTGVDSVQVSLDGAPVRAAAYGRARDDIGAAYGARFENSGFRAILDLTSIAAVGAHEIEVHVHSATTGSETVFTRSVWVSGPQHFGVTAHLMWNDAPSAAAALDRIRASGLGGVRFDVAWDALQPTSADAWSSDYVALLDDVMDMTAARGLQPVLTLLGTPSWARPAGSDRMSPPSDPNDYANAGAWLAARYASHIGLAIEVWNEPNQVQFWTSPGGPNPAAYAQLLAATYTRAKHSAPSVVILGGSLDFNDAPFLQAMYAAGVGGHFDALALHPYADANAPDATDNPERSFVIALASARQLMIDQGDTDKTIWITEMGWSTVSVPDAVRAHYFQRAVELVRARPWVAGFFAYSLGQDADLPDYALTAPDGTPTTSWTAFLQAAAPR